MKWSNKINTTPHMFIYARAMMSFFAILLIVLILQGCGKDADSSDAKYKCSISVTYEKSTMSYNDSVDIIIDDEVIGSISVGNDTKIDVELASGTHKVWAKSNSSWHKKRKSNKASITVDGDDSYTFKLKDESIAGLKIYLQE